MTNSTVSSESAPRSSTNDESLLTSSSPTPRCSQSIFLTLSSFLSRHPRFKNIHFESIGPAIMSGRVVALDVNPINPNEFYVAYASGGVWHTKDNGISFMPIMDNAPTQNIGEIKVNWSTKEIWVGTGENNSSRSSYAGIGILKSNNNGKTWTHHGLSETHHIGKIIIDSENPEHIIVGSTGPLYSKGEERGVFISKDNGETWNKTLYINNETGIIDMVQVPESPEIIYASTWEKERKAWNFSGSGKSSGIYKSIDSVSYTHLRAHET